MSYDSVDVLQRVLTKEVFHYANDAKKAAGRALGTLVEMISFYLIKSWGFEKNTAIERHLPEYANPDITHNVEFSLHPSYEIANLDFSKSALPLTSKKIAKTMSQTDWAIEDFKTTQLLTSDLVLRNSCVLYEDNKQVIIAYLGKIEKSIYTVYVHQFTPHPFAIIECKRVGVEEGTKKGPQTIEKAKQGAYVARTVSSLQKIRIPDGSIYGILNLDSGELMYEPYEQFLKKVITSNNDSLLRDFTLTAGVVSNHGNWFTSNNHNKELKVLAQSYDWLLFLTDIGLSEFVESLLINPQKKYEMIKETFINSYTGKKSMNRFTKVRIALEADILLQEYFMQNLKKIETWFNVISPINRSIDELKEELKELSVKNWKEILS